MITKVQIENFKSIEKLSLSLGRVNVLIGENGCGKTNILEGIAMAAAGDAKNLEEYLGNRGIRITSSAFMRSCFEGKKQDEKIITKLQTSNELDFDFEFLHDNKSYSNWEINKLNIFELIEETQTNLNELPKLKKSMSTLINSIHDSIELEKKLEGNFIVPKQNKKILPELEDSLKRINLIHQDYTNDYKDIIKEFDSDVSFIKNFVIYAPENHFLRKTDEIGTVEPLGYRGEGLIKLLSVLHQEKPEAIEKIKEKLRLISWFEDFEIVSNGFTGSYVKIRDGYLGKDIYYPSLKSTNEGFLFLLFYLSLFIAEYTPKFFAIDNIDNALNPKLCRELIKVLTQLAKEHDKQVIFTTHNPAVLDGLNLDDEEQRLFVVYRNAEGHTKVRRVKKRETPEGYEPMRMSEQYMNGFIGGLPKNF